MTELREFLDKYKTGREPVYLCYCSEEFMQLWAKDRTKIQEKAKLFISGVRVKHINVCYSNSKTAALFTTGGYFIRELFLEWCIEKGYETINDLFI